jgi:hypothetical protein
MKHHENWNLPFFPAKYTGCKLIIFVLLLFHQLSDGDGLDGEATRDSTLGSSSEMIIEVSLTIVGNIAVVMMVLAKKKLS